MADELNKVLHIIFILTYRCIADAPTPPPVTEEQREGDEETAEEVFERQGN